MWNTESVKELFEHLNNTWIDKTDEPLNIKYRECIGNFISFIDTDEDGSGKVLYISEMANDPSIPEDIVKMKFIYAFLVFKHSFEISRFIHFNNASGIIEFLENSGKYICEKCGYTFYSHDDIHSVINEKTMEYMERVLKEHADTAIIKSVKTYDEYKIDSIDSEKFFLRSIKTDEVIRLADLKDKNGDMPYMTINA